MHGTHKKRKYASASNHFIRGNGNGNGNGNKNGNGNGNGNGTDNILNVTRSHITRRRIKRHLNIKGGGGGSGGAKGISNRPNTRVSLRKKERSGFKPLQCGPLGRRQGQGLIQVATETTSTDASGAPLPSSLAFTTTLPTCYTDEQLQILRELWNSQHHRDPIASKSPSDILQHMHTKYNKVCSSEKCWLQKIVSENAQPNGGRYRMLSDAFAPTAKWSRNPNKWLSSDDILNVMRQYEKRYKCFEFIGPSPIDYDKVPKPRTGFTSPFVCPKLRNLSIQELAAQHKHKIGIIFNMDTHTQDGSHWVSMFIHVKKKQIVYFDSTGDPIPAQLRKLVTTIQTQRPDFTFHDIAHVHQRGDTECGIYSLFFIINMLEDKVSLEYLRSHSLSDDYIHQFRAHYFNIA